MSETPMDEIDRICAGLSEGQQASLSAYQPNMAYGARCPWGVSGASKRGLARRGLIRAAYRNPVSFHADYELTDLGLRVRARLDEVRS